MKSGRFGDELLTVLGDQRRFVVEIGEASQLGMPLLPLFLGRKEVVPDIAEKFDFHDVNFLH